MIERYFDVESADVFRRSLMAINVFDNTQFISGVPDTVESGKRSDLWGPIWIYQTVVFAQFFGSSLGNLIYWKGAEPYDIGSFAASATSLALFTFGVPALVWFAVQYLNLVSTFTWGQSVCLYGYANVVWVPVAVVLAFIEPISGKAGTIARWAVIGLAALVPGKFVLFNLQRLFSNAESDKSKASGVLLLCAAIQVAYAIAFGLLWKASVIKT